MTGMYGDPTKHIRNPLFRLWKFVEGRASSPPTTKECAEYMGVSNTQVRYWLRSRLRLFVSGSWNHHYPGSGKRGMDYDTWTVTPWWTSEMINKPFPTPRGWKPVQDKAEKV